MASGQVDRLYQQVRTLVATENSGLSDHELLQRFALHREEAAFEILVRRHGPMVLRVCQGVLRDPHLSDDAFQTTFLVLVRKVSSLQKHTSLASWLYKVAYRAALHVQGAASRRRRRESQVPTRPASTGQDEVMWRDMRTILDEELQRLPEKYQAPVVLCCLEGLARDEAAQQLGWSPGMLKGRLERGREMLRSRLSRRGVALSGALGAALLAEGAAQADVPAALVEATVRGACGLSSDGAAAAGVISAHVGSLVQGVTRAMLLTKVKMVLAVVLAAGLFATAAGTMVHRILASREPQPRAADQPKSKPIAANPPSLPEHRAARVDRYGDALPDGAVARLGTPRFRHMHTISSIAYSRDGKRLLSGSWDGTARLWDANTGEELLRLKGAGDGFSSVAISPDGTILAGGNMRRTLFFWDADTGKEIRRIENLENTVFGLRFAPDGKSLAGVSGNTVRVWDTATGQERRKLTGSKEDIRPFAFSADLKTFAAGLPDGSVDLWDLTAAKADVQRFSGRHPHLACLALSPDGKTLATGGNEHDKTVHLWDRVTGKELHRFGPYAGWVESLMFAPDSQAVAVGEQFGTIHVYEVADGKERCRCGLQPGSWVRGLAFSPDGKTLAGGGTDCRALRFFDAETGKEKQLFAGHQNEVVSATLSADGKSLLSAGKDGVLCLWDLGTAQEKRRWMVNPKGVSAVAVAPDGRYLVTAGEPILRLWEVESGKEIRQFVGHKEAADAVAFSSDGKVLASGGWQDHTIRLWDVESGKERLQIRLPMPNGHNYGSLPLVFADGGKVLISGSGDRANPVIFFWDPATGKELHRIEQQASHLVLTPDGKSLATAGWDRRVHFWDVASRRETTQFAADASALAISRDGRSLAYGGTDGVIHLRELATGQERRMLAGHQPGGDEKGTFAAGVAVLVFASDSRTLISGGGDTTLLVWDTLAPEIAARGTPPSLDHLWKDLAADGVKAHQAMASLITAQSKAVSFLKGKLRPTASPNPQRVARLIAELDNDDFTVRECVAQELERMGESAAPQMGKALAETSSAETRRRLQDVLQKLEGPPSGERLRSLRAIEALEHIATPEALDLLRTLAKGAPEAQLTRDAKASADRLKPTAIQYFP